MTPPVEFRRAVPGDVGELVRLIESAYRGEPSRAGWTTEADLLGGQRTDAEEVGSVVAGCCGFMLIGCDQGAAVACAQLERRGEEAYFGMFAVDPRRQGGGLGSLLLAEAERAAREELGASVLHMTVIRQRDDLIEWYERRGFRRTGETRPFPYGDERYGIPRRPDLEFVVLAKPLGGEGPPG